MLKNKRINKIQKIQRIKRETKNPNKLNKNYNLFDIAKPTQFLSQS
jgi:hypothetical protein